MDRRDFLKGLLAAPAALASFKGLEALTPAEVPAKLATFRQEVLGPFDGVGILSVHDGKEWEGIGFLSDFETTRSLNGRVIHSIGQVDPVDVGFGIDDSVVRARLCVEDAGGVQRRLLDHTRARWRFMGEMGSWTWEGVATEGSLHVSASDQPIYLDIAWMVIGAMEFERA